jgi:GntR family histidine utilization transcriptional repressor
VFHTVLVHLENGVPIQWEDRYVNPRAAPDYLKTDFSQTSPTLHLLQNAPLTEASYAIEAACPRPRRRSSSTSSAATPVCA